MVADERRLKQMLVNLLNNAVKFTPQGGQVGLHVSGDMENNLVHLSVWDTGIGIAPEDIQHLFKPFVQLDGGLTRQHEGTGLGLSLVARMAEIHGGNVQVSSELGQGSRFTITLPWTEAMRVSPRVFAESNVERERKNVSPVTMQADTNASVVLVAEDNEASILTLTVYLQAQGHRVIVARNGAEAIDMACAERPALVLMDLQMPVMDGLEAIQRLRQHRDAAIATMPIFALTALAMPGDRERSLAAGANEYMTKPVNLKYLNTLIEQYLKHA
jgi:CheY-like chemotaxis protein